MPTKPLLFDRPHTEMESDWMGFPVIANGLAHSLIACLNRPDSLVVGIEGPWGSGKSTLAGYVVRQIRRDAPNIEIVELSPWLSGDHESLASALLAAIGNAIERRRTPTCGAQLWRSLRKISRSKWTKTILQYGARTARATRPALKLIPGADIAEPWVSAGASAMQTLSEGKSARSTADLKKDIEKYILETECRFLVVIDDLDRLEPAQAVEVVRVVRSVADFPQMVHLLCYDRVVLSHAIQSGLDVPDGDAFLEKVIQLSLPMPLPEANSLQSHLEREAIALYCATHNLHSRDLDPGVRNEIARAFRDWGGSMRTPRQVKLVLNHLLFSYPQIAGRVNFADLCSINLIKATNRPLYQWIERYLVLFSIYAGSDLLVSADDRKALGEALKRLVPKLGIVHEIHRLVPGIGEEHGDDPANVVFSCNPSASYSDYEARRLGSPYHYRYYFANAGASAILPEEDWQELRRASARSADATTSALAALLGKEGRSAGWHTMAIDWLVSRDVLDRMTSDEIRHVLAAVGNLLDTLQTPFDDFANRHRWRKQAPAALIMAMHRPHLGLEPEQVDQAVLHFMAHCRSPIWLISEFFRTEMHSHGFAENPPKLEDEWLISERAFDSAVDIVWTKLNEFLNKPNPLEHPQFAGLIFSWRELTALPSTKADSPFEINAWVAAHTETDAAFIAFLTAMRGQVYTAAQRYFILRGKDLDLFDAMSGFRARLDLIADQSEDIVIRDQARGLQQALALEKEF